MTQEPERTSITDHELTELLAQLPASSAAIGTVLLRLVTELREIKEAVGHVANAIDDFAKQSPSTNTIRLVVEAIDKLREAGR
jgi:hypothetical protein